MQNGWLKIQLQKCCSWAFLVYPTNEHLVPEHHRGQDREMMTTKGFYSTRQRWSSAELFWIINEKNKCKGSLSHEKSKPNTRLTPALYKLKIGNPVCFWAELNSQLRKNTGRETKPRKSRRNAAILLSLLAPVTAVTRCSSAEGRGHAPCRSVSSAVLPSLIQNISLQITISSRGSSTWDQIEISLKLMELVSRKILKGTTFPTENQEKLPQG